MGLSRTVSEINGNFGRKSQSFTTPHVFHAPTEGVPLQFCNGGKAQKRRNMPLPDGGKSLMISAFVNIQ